jgi:LmbE family N-acetylglucosaminyl deacetylase
VAFSVLAVTSRPGQESEDLGRLLYAFRRTGARLSLLCLTRGEAAAQNSACTRLEAIRPRELRLAAAVLGISEVTVASYPDGELHQHPEAELTDRIRRAIRQHTADLLLIIAPAADNRDDTAVARAARAAAAQAGVPVMARTPWRALPAAGCLLLRTRRRSWLIMTGRSRREPLCGAPGEAQTQRHPQSAPRDSFSQRNLMGPAVQHA